MRKVFVTLVALGLFFVASPTFAVPCGGDICYGEELGVLSIGLGGGFGEDVEVGPFVLSGKYWDPQWEIGAEVFWSGDEEDEYDQIGLAWLAFRYDLSVSEGNATYVGLGGAGVFQEYSGFENSFGAIGLIGWDSDVWGLEFKYAYLDPSIMSVVAYYHFY